MPRISATGIGGSGLDINSIVQQLVSVEKQPIDAARRKQVSFTAKLGSFASLRGSLSNLQSSLVSLQSLSSFQSKSVVASDSNVLKASATTVATVGTSTVNQVIQRAKANKLQSGIFDSGTAVVGTGKLKIRVGEGTQRDILIDSDHQTLTGVRDAINTSNAGVTASILKINETDYKLLLEARETGEKNAIEIDLTDDDGDSSDSVGLSQFRQLAETQAAQDAVISIDQVTFTRSTNTITDAIPGVTLTLLKETGDNANISIDVSSNADAVRGKVESFVSSYNNVMDALNTAQSFDKGAATKGLLLGNAAARLITDRLQSLSKSRVVGLDSAQNSLVQIGLITDSKGKLKIDSAKFDAALKADPLAVGRVFASVSPSVDPTVTTSTSGIADLMNKAITDLTDNKRGGIAIQERGLRGSIAAISEQVIKLEQGASSFEKKTRERFAKLEGLLEQLQGTGAVINRQITQLENLSGSLLNRNQRSRFSAS